MSQIEIKITGDLDDPKVIAVLGALSAADGQKGSKSAPGGGGLPKPDPDKGGSKTATKKGGGGGLPKPDPETSKAATSSKKEEKQPGSELTRQDVRTQLREASSKVNRDDLKKLLAFHNTESVTAMDEKQFVLFSENLAALVDGTPIEVVVSPAKALN